MTAIAAGRIERSRVPLRINPGRYNNRTATDKYWSLLFIVFFIIFIATGRYVLRYKPNCQIDSDNSTATNVTSEFVNNKTDCNVVCDNRTIVNKTIEYYGPHIWGNSWVFDAITCNVGFLDAHYEESGLIVILAHLLICGALVIYSFASMRTDDLYRRLLQIFIGIFVFCTYMTRNYIVSNNPSESYLIFLSIPEVILIIMACTKLPLTEKFTIVFNDDRGRPVVSIGDFNFVSFMWVYMFAILPSILIGAATKDYELNWNNGWYSHTFAGVSCYLILAIYYFILMVISCSNSHSYDRRYIHPKDFFRAVFIVVRYHFGTACYQATLIFPRIHATFVANEREFRESTKFSTIYRLYLTHWKLHDLSITVSAVRGCSHCASMRELLRLFISDSPEEKDSPKNSSKLKNFQMNSQMLRSVSALLIAMNSLMFISLWVHGVVLDPRAVTTMWVTTVIGIFIVKLTTKLLDVAGDVLWLRYDGKVAIKA